MRNKFLFNLLKGHLFITIVVVFLTIIHRFTFSYIPLFSQMLIERLEYFIKGTNSEVIKLPKFIYEFIMNKEILLTSVLAIIMSLLIWQLFRYILLYFETLLKGFLKENVSRDLRYNSYNHIQNLSFDYHNNADSGDLIQRVTSDIDSTTEFSTRRIFDFLGILSAIIFGSYQLYFINKTIMLFSLLVIPISALASIVYFIKIDKIFLDVEEKESELMVVIQENISASRVVRSFGNERYELEKLEEKNINYREAEIRANKLAAIYWGLMDFLMIIQYLIVLLLGIFYAYYNQMDVASITASIMLAGMLIWPVRGLGRIVSEYGKALVASNRLNEIFKEEDEYINDGTLTPIIKGNIEFRNVSFKFPESNIYTLENISFNINKSETVAIIGKTGSGKTTLINILLKMYDYEGSILIDGVELRDIKKRHIRKNIGTVLQDPFLYSKTVYQNISIMNKNESNENIINASKIASLDHDINTFNNGYETIVGEQGTTLSGGQRQRVAIARILVTKRPIIILDDALSALDNKTDSLVRESIKKNNKDNTNIIVTHRITTAKDADKIIVIGNKTILNIGTHDSLIKEVGLYQDLFNLQNNLEASFYENLGGNDEN